MPTKPNRSGQQQNYIPAGNGDASGEYGDNATGSNIHFKVFKKPEDKTPLKSNEIKQEDYDSAVDYLDKSLRDYDDFRKTNKEVKLGYHVSHDYDKIKQLYSNAVIKEKASVVKIANAYKKQAEKGKPYWVINDAFGSNGAYYFSKTKADEGQKGIVINPSTFDSLSSNYGSTWFHENGHLLDNTFNDGEGNYSSDYVSKKYNKTLKDMLNEEFEAYFTKERKQEIIDKIEALRNRVYASYGYDYKDMEEKRRYFNDLLKPYKEKLKKDYAEIDAKYDRGEIDGWGHIMGRAKIKERYQIDTWAISNQISRLISKKKKEQIELNVAREVYKNYSTITDMYSSLGKGRLHAEYGGYHDKKYWQSDENKRVKEFFAESFSGKTLNDTHFEQLKQAFPKSVEIFEEIYGEIK